MNLLMFKFILITLTVSTDQPNAGQASDAEICASKACGDICTPECPLGMACPDVVYFCQPDGSCTMDADPKCPDSDCAEKACGEDCTPKCPLGMACADVVSFCQPDGSCDTNADFQCPKADSITSPTEGCRAPGDFYEGVSCESCCDQNLKDCLEHSGEEWYNSVRFLPDSQCPEACPQCASCSVRDEDTLRQLQPPPQCNPLDCADMKIGVDPCFAVNSCECFCETANNLFKKCPQVKPDWLPQVSLRKLGDTCGVMMGIGDVGQCEAGLRCACMGGECMVDGPMTCVPSDTPRQLGEACGLSIHGDLGDCMTGLDCLAVGGTTKIGSVCMRKEIQDGDCICPVGRRELMVNPEGYGCELDGYELIGEIVDYKCPDGSIQECGGPGWVCENAEGDRMSTIDLPVAPGTVNGEEFCEAPDMLRNEDACKSSTCCHWNTWEAGEASFDGTGRCQSDIGQAICNDMGTGSATKTILKLGQKCCDFEGNISNEACTSTCEKGLECTFFSQDTGGPICQIKLETMTWITKGPWDLTKIQDESESLVMVFTQTLGLPPFSTSLSVTRVNGIVQVAFTTMAPAAALTLLKEPSFQSTFERNVLQYNQDLATAMFINTNEVVGLFVLEGPWDIDAVQEAQEALRSHFAFVLRMDPDQVEEEFEQSSGNGPEGKITQIIYKAKGTPMQIAPLYDGELFSSNLRKQISSTDPALAQLLDFGVCPSQEPGADGVAPCHGEMTCKYGQECCCGECHASIVYQCYEGRWSSFYTDACMAPCSGNAFPGRRQGILRKPQLEEPSASSNSPNRNYAQLILVTVFAVILGIFAGQLCQWLCSKKQTSNKDLTADLYHDISLDADLARSV